MSAEIQREGGTMTRCASCGVKEGDDVKLRDCAACHLVKYCGVKCQKEHRPKHKRACKKRAAELHDEILFRQPDSSHIGDCPICFLPLPLDEQKSPMMRCCGKIVCDGCNYANQMRELQEKQDPKCAFCRQPVLDSIEEDDKRIKDRAAMNDPIALRDVGLSCVEEGDYQGAFEYLSQAAELGDVGAHSQLALMYHYGQGVEKDETKTYYHNEQAAIAGHPRARHNLACIEFDNGRHERAVKHFTIAAKLGLDESLTKLKELYKYGLVNKDDLAAALRGHQAAVDAMKSPQREEAAVAAADLYPSSVCR